MTRGYHREVPPLSQTRAYGALVAIVALWGSYPATAKLALQDFPPFFLAAVRCSVASFFLAWLLARAGPDASCGLSPRALGAFLVLALAGIWGSTQGRHVPYYYTPAGSALTMRA